MKSPATRAPDCLWTGESRLGRARACGVNVLLPLFFSRRCSQDGGCWLDTLQGRFYVYGADGFTELTLALADLMAAVVGDESERLR